MTRVMGWALRRQLSVPGVGLSMSAMSSLSCLIALDSACTHSSNNVVLLAVPKKTRFKLTSTFGQRD